MARCVFQLFSCSPRQFRKQHDTDRISSISLKTYLNVHIAPCPSFFIAFIVSRLLNLSSCVSQDITYLGLSFYFGDIAEKRCYPCNKTHMRLLVYCTLTINTSDIASSELVLDICVLAACYNLICSSVL